MEFENTTQYDQRTISALVEVMTRVTQKQTYSRQRSVMLTLGILFFSAGAVMMYASVPLFRVFGFLLLALGAGVLLEFCLLRRNIARSIQRFLPGGSRTFRFTQEDIQAEHAGGQQERYSYRQIASAYEAGGCFVLLLDNGSWLMAAREGFTKGTAEDFRQFLTDKLGSAVVSLHTGFQSKA